MFLSVLQKSIHGRRFGLNSTGLPMIIDRDSGVAFGALMRSTNGAMPASEITTQSSAATTLNAYGVNLVSSATSGALSFTLPRPDLGSETRIALMTSATTVTIGGTSTSILFYQGTAETLAGSTALVFSSSEGGGNVGRSVTLLGVSTARWLVTAQTPTIDYGIA